MVWFYLGQKYLCRKRWSIYRTQECGVFEPFIMLRLHTCTFVYKLMSSKVPVQLQAMCESGLGSSTVDQVLKYTKYPKYIPSRSTGQVLIFSSFFFFRKNYLLLSCATSVRLSSVEIFSFRGNSLSSKPIDLKIGLNVREGVVHVRKAWFFEILIASCKLMQFAIFCK